MRKSMMSLLMMIVIPACAGAADALGVDAPVVEHAEWAQEFSSRGVRGTALVFNEKAHRFEVFDRTRAQMPVTPASTFKLFNAMVALDTGAVKDEYEVVRWDGVERSIADWNRDQSLASAMKFSAVWFYQEMARRAGPARMQRWIDKGGYGNRDIGGGIDRFWLDGGALRISAAEQIGFLRRLADGTLPFSARAQETVRRISIIEDAPDHILHGKTGWSEHGGVQAADLGWIVGWLERDGRRWFYAVEIDSTSGFADAPKRIAIARAVLARAGAL